MTELMGYTTWLTAISLLLLLGLFGIYLYNYTKIRAQFTLGLMLFVGLFIIQNAISFYYFITMMPYYAPEVEMHVFSLSLLQAIAFSVMLWQASR